MAPTGSTFIDWQQLQVTSRLRIDEDFSWSEPPRRRRRPVSDEPIRARGRSALRAAAEGPADTSAAGERLPVAVAAREAPTAARTDRFDEPERFEPRRRRDRPRASRMFDLSDPGATAGAGQSRRTVVISGRGAEHNLPAPRRRPTAQLRFHERAGLRPDRAGMWAVLLGIALVLAALVH